MKKGTKTWLEFAHRDLEAAKLHSPLAEKTRISLAITEDELDLVDAVYIDARYPSGIGLLPSGFPTNDDARELLQIAEKTYREVSHKLIGR